MNNSNRYPQRSTNTNERSRSNSTAYPRMSRTGQWARLNQMRVLNNSTRGMGTTTTNAMPTPTPSSTTTTRMQNRMTMSQSQSGRTNSMFQHFVRRNQPPATPNDKNSIMNNLYQFDDRHSHKFIRSYLKNPMGMKQFLNFEMLKRPTSIRDTKFEEFVIQNPPVPAAQTTRKSNVEDQLERAIQYFYSNFKEGDGSPLLLFHIVLYKNINIQQLFQYYLMTHLSKVNHQKSIKHQQTAKASELTINTIKQITRLLHKRDEHKGLFAAFSKSKLESITKHITVKNIPAKSLKGLEGSNGTELKELTTFLFENAINMNQQKKKRNKALSSLVVIAFGRGNLLDILSLLNAVLSYNVGESILFDLKNADHDSPVLHMSSDAIKSIQQFQSHVVDMRLKMDKYEAPNKELVGDQAIQSKEKNISIGRLLLSIIFNLDLIAQYYLRGNKLLTHLQKQENSKEILYATSMNVETFEMLLLLLEKTCALSSNSKEIRTYFIEAIIRILRLNVKMMALQQKSIQLDEYRRAFTDIYTYSNCLLNYNLQEKEKKNISETDMDDMVLIEKEELNIKEISDSIQQQTAQLIVDGLVLFFPNVEDRSKTMHVLIESNSKMQTTICSVLFKRMANDWIFMFEVLGGTNFQTTSRMSDFMIGLLSKSSKISFELFDYIDKFQLDEHQDAISKSFKWMKNCNRILVLWMQMLAGELTPPIYKNGPSSIPKIAFTSQNELMKQFIRFSTNVFKESMSLLSAASRYVFSKYSDTEKCKSFLEKKLKHSIVGYLLQPLLHIFSTFLWNVKRTTFELNQIKELSGLIYQPLVNLLNGVSSFNTIFDTKEIAPDWKIAETDHPYKHTREGTVKYKNSDGMPVAMKFDDRSQLNQTANDNIQIQTNNSRTMQFPRNKLPSNVFVSYGEDFSVKLSSDTVGDGQQYSEWGVRTYFFPLSDFNWLYTIERSIGWLGGRLASFSLSFPIKTISNQNLLNSQLFVDGMQVISKKMMKIVNDLENDDSILANTMYTKLKMESMMFKNNKSIIGAEKKIIATIIKHTSLQEEALKIIKSKNAPKTLDHPIVKVFRAARSIRFWMSNQDSDLMDLSEGIISRCQFILKFAASSVSKLSQLPSGAPSMQKKGVKDQQNLPVQVVGGASTKTVDTSMDDEEAPSLIESISELILEFVKDTSIDEEELTQAIISRQHCTEARATAFKMYTTLVKSTQFNSIRGDIIRTLSLVLVSENMKIPNELSYHYFHNLTGAGSSRMLELQTSFAELIKSLIPSTQFENKIIHSGLLRQILNTLYMSFGPMDVKWIIDYEFINVIVNLMFKIEDSPAKHGVFFLTDPMESEKYELHLLAWRIFGLISLRTLQMIANWKDEKNTIVSDIREDVRAKLDHLRALLFDTIFSKLEHVLRVKHTSTFLEELLRLIYSLSHSPVAQPWLNCERFYRQILPLLNINSVIVVSLTLKICSNVFTSEDGFSNFDQNERIVEKMLYILGDYQLQLVTGRSFSLQTIQLGMVKEIYFLIKKLISPSANINWKRHIKTIIESIDITSMVQLYAKASVPSNQLNKLLLVLAVLMIIDGFTYIPSRNESVEVLVHNEYKPAKVVLNYESTHIVGVRLDHSDGSKCNYFPFENIRLPTDTLLVSALSENILTQLNIFLKESSTKKKMLQSNEIRLICSHIEMKSLSIIHRICVKKNEGKLDMNTSMLLENFPLFVDQACKVNKTVQYGKTHKLDSCSFTYTGKDYSKQIYYNCKTCQMGSTKAVCSYCAKTCHRNHVMGPAEIGRFYCDCGTGEGRYRCLNLHHAPPEPVHSLERMRSIQPRLSQLLILYCMRYVPCVYLNYFTNQLQQTSIMPTTFLGPPEAVVNGKKIVFQSLESKTTYLQGNLPVPSNWAGFYYELEILKIARRFYFGFKVGDKDHMVKIEPTAKHCIYGCGFKHSTNSLFFTKNGLKIREVNLGTNNHISPIIFLDSANDIACRYNFGHKSFAYDLNNDFESIGQNTNLRPISNYANSKNPSNLTELSLLGYKENESREVLTLCKNNLNAAMSYIHHNHTQGDHAEADERRMMLAKQLEIMGFPLAQAKQALAMNNYEINASINWLIEGNGQAYNSGTGELSKSEDSLHGVIFDKKTIDEAQMTALFVYPNAPINDSRNINADLNQLKIGDIVNNASVVTNIVSKHPDTSTVTLDAYDARSGTIFTTHLKSNQVTKPVLEFRHLPLSSIEQQAIENIEGQSIEYSRAILGELYRMTNVVVDVTAEKLYRSFNATLLKLLHTQQPIFYESTIKFNDKQVEFIKEISKTKLKNGSFICDNMASEALPYLKDFIKFQPHIRKIVYTKKILNKTQFIKFAGATSLFISMPKVSLPTQHDIVRFSVDGKTPIHEINSESKQSCIIIPSNQVVIQFCTPNLQETVGFDMTITPTCYMFNEQFALDEHPNLSSVLTILDNTTDAYWDQRRVLDMFKLGFDYLMLPMAPYKGTMCNILERIIKLLMTMPKEKLPALDRVEDFRFQLETIYNYYNEKYIETSSLPLPSFHSLIEFMASIRPYFSSDLCVNKYRTKKNHFYSTRTGNVDSLICTSCIQASEFGAQFSIMYAKHAVAHCNIGTATKLMWNSNYDVKFPFNSLVPIHKLKLNPSEWFEHISWLDQLAIVKLLSHRILYDKLLPKWALYELAIESRNKVQYHSSPHPYKLVNDMGHIKLPGASSLYVSFDKHSKTHVCDRLRFSSSYPQGNDLGEFSGDDLKDTSFIVHGNELHYSFVCQGGNHKLECHSCKQEIHGCRYCCTVCDKVNFCERCVQNRNAHFDDHIFLKLRRPVHCTPAPVPMLYPRDWKSRKEYHRNVHHNVECSNCKIKPIVGVRYWCENCPNYNLCERCGSEEYKYHNRLHVFLRIVRPLPDIKYLPSNALPYGLLYEQELDTFWGYHFSVNSTNNAMSYNDSTIEKDIQHIVSNTRPFTKAQNIALVKYVESFSTGWQSMQPYDIIEKDILDKAPSLPRKDGLLPIRLRFLLLKLFNRKVSRILSMLDLSSEYEYGTYDPNHSFHAEPLSLMLVKLKHLLFNSVKLDAWQSVIEKSYTTCERINLQLNRHLAAEPLKFNEGEKLNSRNSIFNQAFTQLHSMHPRILCRKGGAWKVTFLGESADDYGGLFRETLSQLSHEIQNETLELMVHVPNFKNEFGNNREKFIPNPQSVAQFKSWFKFVGVLLGVGLITKNELPLDFSSIFWKGLSKEKVDRSDFQAFDTQVYNSIQSIRHIDKEGIDEDSFDDMMLADNFTTQSTAGYMIPLCEDGENRKVTFANREEYCNLVEEFRIKECDSMIQSIREGLHSLVHPRYFSLFSWSEIEHLCTGSPDIDLDVLKKHTVYEGYNAKSREIKYFWKVLEEFTKEQRSMYLRFVWGRSRLPIDESAYTHPMKIQKLSRKNPDQVLPLSHTCFFSIELPPYSSKSVLKRKLLYAITNCKAIDTDFTNEANNALRMA